MVRYEVFVLGSQEIGVRSREIGFRFWGFGVLVQFPHFPIPPLPHSPTPLIDN
ncbi:hypothetical protein [Microcystis sp. LE19-195.1E]|uniref:hypothetical protein n=1 Tax=Microcystis sp. LE19-195.1E TaxID=3016440 RepID=UPI00258FE554|nr:hypothetical protein [Microcystis sp. LE19-195.1E]